MAPLSLAAYRLIFWLTTPFWRGFLRRRVRRNKEDGQRWPERMGKISSPRMAGTVVWIHAVSVGEAVAVLPLLERLPEICGANKIHILLTTGTYSAAQLVAPLLPADAFHQYAPLDHPLYVRRFLSHWRPDMAILVESELWPNMICETGRRHIPMALINARLSLASLRRWLKQKSLARFLLSHFDLCLAQDQTTAEGLRQLGAKNIFINGSLKYDAPPLSADQKEIDFWRQLLGQRLVFLAASTHEGEEEIIAQAFLSARDQGHDVAVIIAPRHPARGGQIAEKMRQHGLTVMRRSEILRPDILPDIYIADRLGEMGLFYRLASIVFMGGSLIKHGGQNPLEPARLDCAIISGPHVFNFSDIYDRFARAHGVEMVSETTCGEVLCRLLDDENHVRAMKQSAKEIEGEMKGVLNSTLNHIAPLAKKMLEK